MNGADVTSDEDLVVDVLSVRLHDLAREILKVTFVTGPHNLRPALDKVILESAFLSVAGLLAVGADDGGVLSSHYLSSVSQLDCYGPINLKSSIGNM